MRLALLATLGLIPGCMLFFDDGGKRPPVCQLGDTAGTDPALAPALKRDPESLTCVDFGPTCDPACGPCPESDAPEVTWNFCGHVCEGLDESACAANAECRVVRDARCAVAGNCLTDFVGCFPTDTAAVTTIDCRGADAWSCSRDSSCSALHFEEQPCPSDDACRRPFALCIDEGADPGRCFEPAECRAEPPPCPTSTRPGVANGCWTGVCIPLEACEPAT